MPCCTNINAELLQDAKSQFKAQMKEGNNAEDAIENALTKLKVMHPKVSNDKLKAALQYENLLHVAKERCMNIICPKDTISKMKGLSKKRITKAIDKTLKTLTIDFSTSKNDIKQIKKKIRKKLEDRFTIEKIHIMRKPIRFLDADILDLDAAVVDLDNKKEVISPDHEIDGSTSYSYGSINTRSDNTVDSIGPSTPSLDSLPSLPSQTPSTLTDANLTAILKLKPPKDTEESSGSSDAYSVSDQHPSDVQSLPDSQIGEQTGPRRRLMGEQTCFLVLLLLPILCLLFFIVRRFASSFPEKASETEDIPMYESSEQTESD